MYKNITGVVLAGGKSRRMGTDKALMNINGKTIIADIAEKMKMTFSQVVIIANEPEVYNFLDLPVFKDVFVGFGPLAGIHSGLVNSNTKKIFVISCDIPLITTDAIEFIVNYNSDKQIIVPKADGFIQQLCGIYDRALIPVIEEILQNEDEENRSSDQKKRKCKVHSLIDRTASEIIDFETEFSGYSPGLFFNMNRPEDYKYIADKLS